MTGPTDRYDEFGLLGENAAELGQALGPELRPWRGEVTIEGDTSG